MFSRKNPWGLALIIYLSAFLMFSFARAQEGKLTQPETSPVVAEPSTKSEAAGETDSSKKTSPKIVQKTQKTQRTKRMFALFDTSMGQFKARLHFKRAPKTVDNFVGLAEGTKEFTDPETNKPTKRRFYDGLTFHRIIDGFMIQGGCPMGTGRGGPGYTFEDEFHPNLRHDKEGILSMANRGPNTNGSQFFITLGAVPHLDAQRPKAGYSIFGEIVEGMDVVKKIGSVKTGINDKPAEDVVIKSVTIIRE